MPQEKIAQQGKTLASEKWIKIVQDPGDNRYFAIVPRSVFYCTYLDKKNKRKKLSCNAIALYTLIRALSGNKGICWASTENLAKMLGRSVGAISAAKKELQMPMEQLAGKPLIKIIEKTRRYKDSSGSTKYHEMSIVNIWPEHHAFIELREEFSGHIDDDSLDVHNSTARSNIESVGTAHSIIEGATPGARSIIERNKITEQKISSVLETDKPEPLPDKSGQRSAPSASSVLLDKKDSVSFGQENTALLQLKSVGADSRMIEEMLKKFEPQRIIDCIEYVWQQRRDGKIKKNFQGYARRAIENEWTIDITKKNHRERHLNRDRTQNNNRRVS